MKAKPERQTPINAGACDSYNVMTKYIFFKKYQNAYTQKTTSTQCATTSSPITLHYELQNRNQNTTV